MNADLKPKWLAALRSGEYTQGQRWLKRGGRYCCLGVLCDIMPEIGWEDEFEGLSAGQRAFDRGNTMRTSTSALPGAHIQKLAGLDRDVDDRLHRDPQVTLVQMNDGSHIYNGNAQSFEQIADWIEENL